MMRPHLFTYVSALFLTLVWLHPTVTSISDDGGNDDAPIGIQVWDTLSSFNKALDSGRLILVMITAAWCEKNDAMEDLVEQAADRIDEAFNSGELPFHPSSKPLIGVLPSETADQLILDGLGPIAHFPALKFVLSTPQNCTVNDDGDDSAADRTKIWNYIGPGETVHDVYDSVMMYWYRNVVSNHIYELSKRKQTTTGTKSKIDSDCSNNKHNPPIFHFSSQTQMASFLEVHGEHFLRPVQARHRHENGFEKEMFEFYTGIQNYDSSVGGIFYPFHSPTGDGGQHNDQVFTQEIDPYILFVQCRSSKRKSENSNEATRIFDELAEEMMHRRDVAFFALEAGYAKSCGGWFPKSSDGAIAVLRVTRTVEYSILPIEDNVSSDQPYWNQRQRRVIRNITTDWNVVKQKIPHDLFIPSDYPHKKDVMSNLNKFIVRHATPTVMWFDKSRVANLAFPKYRTTHAVLFIDIGLGNDLSKSSSSASYTLYDWPENLRYSTEMESLLLDQQRAIEMFYNAAIQYRSQRKDDDVVFLIIPSSETRILNTFGVDLWTPLDEALFGAENEGVGDSDDYNTCKGESSQIMPIMAVTDASESTGKQLSRYYLCPNEMFASSDTIFEHGGAMKTFIDKVLDGTAMQFIRSEELNLNNKYTDTTSNVTVVTGNTFQNVVMDREDEHTMLFMKQSTCGHCKRFSIFWNEFQTIVEALNWSSVISVCKIDVSKNDVPHPQIDAWDLPSVYYFPAGSKENPIEMTPHYDEDTINAQYDYDEGLSWVTSGYDVVKWMMKQGKLDLELLASLDTTEANAIEGDAATSI